MALGNDYPGSYTTDVVAASDSCSDLDTAMSFNAASSFINPPLTRPSPLSSEACFVHRPVSGTILKISASHLWTADGIPSATIASRNNPASLDNYPTRKDPYNFASKTTYSLPNPPPAFRHDTTSKPRKKRAKIHECSSCHKRFSGPATLKTHQNMHTGEQPCFGLAGVRSNMLRHSLTHNLPRADMTHFRAGMTHSTHSRADMTHSPLPGDITWQNPETCLPVFSNVTKINTELVWRPIRSPASVMVARRDNRKIPSSDSDRESARCDPGTPSPARKDY
ncbi:hypothetical protein C8R44DRAFT_734086 [Mycena epipterygia]|nr:hypothetical protein C8R44DRAFT_734086 [Mycena epipterygia]